MNDVPNLSHTAIFSTWTVLFSAEQTIYVLIMYFFWVVFKTFEN